MKSFSEEVSEQNFNLLWRSLHAMEDNLLAIIKKNQDDEDSEEAAFAGNDLVYLRLYRDDLEKKAKNANFGKSSFVISPSII